MKHSAEWYRGALEALDNQRHYSVANLRTHYRQQLAEAEAREAGERESAGVGDLFNAIAYCEGGGYDQGDVSEALYKAYALGANSLADQLAAAQAEAKERTTMAARAQEAMRYLLNGLPATDAIWAAYGNADSARAWLSDRDARMKALGAAEYLEAAAEKRWTLTYLVMREEAAQLRQQAEAARLAEGE